MIHNSISTNKRLPLVLLITILLLFLNSCGALSPQTVMIKTLLDARSQAIGQGRALSISVSDKRPQQAFGSRGGVYQTAMITPRNDVAGAIQQALAERMQASGFNVSTAQNNNPLAMQVEIQSIDYRVTQEPYLGSLVNVIQISAALNTFVRNSTQMLNGQYQASSSRRQVGYASAAENERLINQVIAESLRQFLHDTKVINLLAQL